MKQNKIIVNDIPETVPLYMSAYGGDTLVSGHVRTLMVDSVSLLKKYTIELFKDGYIITFYD